MITLEPHSENIWQFYVDGKALHVLAEKKLTRWSYRMQFSKKVLASGMSPRKFVKAFWMRDDVEGELFHA